MNTIQGLFEQKTLATIAMVVILFAAGMVFSVGLRIFGEYENKLMKGIGVAFAATAVIAASFFFYALSCAWQMLPSDNVKFIWLKAAMSTYPPYDVWWPTLLISASAFTLGFVLFSADVAFGLAFKRVHAKV